MYIMNLVLQVFLTLFYDHIHIHPAIEREACFQKYCRVSSPQR